MNSEVKKRKYIAKQEKIDIPPTRGTFPTCIFLLDGLSTKPIFSDIFEKKIKKNTSITNKNKSELDSIIS